VKARRHLAILSSIAALCALPACENRRATERYAGDEIVRSTGGDIDHGNRMMRRYGCNTCHEIPGVAGAMGSTGPSLEGIALRGYLAGRLENNVPNMIQWIRHPHAVDSLTVMPEMGVTEQDARDIAAYLYTLR
jgi:cytochrome c